MKRDQNGSTVTSLNSASVEGFLKGQMRNLLPASLGLALLGMALIVYGVGSAAGRVHLEEEYYIVDPSEGSSMGMGGWGGVRQARLVALWGGAGKATTGTSVDGRKTVPGLHTDCIPGVLSSDCSPAQVRLSSSPSTTCIQLSFVSRLSPLISLSVLSSIPISSPPSPSLSLILFLPLSSSCFSPHSPLVLTHTHSTQEDGAWSTDAQAYLDRVTGGGHSSGMQKIQDDIDAGYAAREKFLADCLEDASLCSGRGGTVTDTPRFGSRTHAWAPEQGQDWGKYDNDGRWAHIPLPSGTSGDGGLVSSAYYS